MEVSVQLVFHESPLSPWARRPQSRRAQPQDVSPRFQTVGSLNAVNIQVAAEGLQQRGLLPFLVVDTVDCIEPPSPTDMPPKRRGATHPQARHAQKPKISEKRTRATVIEKPAVDQGEKTSLIELATYPGYTPSSPTPLPQSLDTMEQMRRVTRAQAKLAAKREGYREYWRENFYSPASQTIFLDTFWWFFLERYQPLKAVQSSLFGRVAENYVKFLTKAEIHTWKDKFLKAYPDALAQCVYTAFIHAFPASWTSFDDNFKSALVEIVYLWQTGTRPMPELWKRWNFAYLDPPDSLKTIQQEDNEALKLNKTSFRLDELVEEAREKAEEDAPVIISDHQSSDSIDGSSPYSSGPSQSQQDINRTELERALTKKLFLQDRHNERTPQETAVTLTHSQTGRCETSFERLDIARSQYLRLRQEKMTPHKRTHTGKSVPRKPMNTQKTGPPKLQEHTKTIGKLTRLRIDDRSSPPLPPLAPKRTTTGNGQPQCNERPPGSLKPCTEAEEIRGRTDIVVNIDRGKFKKMNETKGLQIAAKISQFQSTTQTKTTPSGEVRDRSEDKATDEVKLSTAHQDRGKRTCRNGGRVKVAEKNTNIIRDKPAQSAPPPSGNHRKQTSNDLTSTHHPPHLPLPHVEKPAGSLKPTSAAEEYGLSNYVSKDGEKESTWKEKAIIAREKTNKRPINILHKLHHQGTPLAVPEADTVCFNLFGRSPLVKHYMQKRRLNKVTGYAILTKRTEINQVIPSGAPTYDDVIKESLQESQQRSAHLASQKRQCKKQLQKILQERMKRREKYKRQLRQLLSAQKEVESLSNELVDYWQERGMDKRQGVASLKQSLSPDMQRTLTTSIEQAFQRCSHSSP